MRLTATLRWVETHYRRLSVVAAATAALATAPVNGQDPGVVQIASELSGLRYGISVTDLDGNVLIAHRADERFMPASNAKLLVTAAALAAATELSTMDHGLQVVSEWTGSGPPTLVLVGRGDPTVGFSTDCEVRCLETLAEAVAASGITEIGDIVGDDQWFADEPKPLGWSWDDLKFGHGTSISAIAVNDNVVPIRVSPSNSPGSALVASWIDDGSNYFSLQNEAKTSGANEPRALRLERRAGGRAARLYGELPIESRPITLDLGVDDPAHFAAWHFKKALEAEGVRVSGEIQTRHRSLQYADEPRPADVNDPASPPQCGDVAQVTARKTVIASLPPAPLQEIITEINRDSQNLYAEVLLRQLGRVAGSGSTFCGVLAVEEFLQDVGVPHTSYEIADGSGLSNYNRVTPATITALLRHAAATSWGDAFRATLPVSGASAGTLKYRFRGTPLEGKVFAKTGTLNHVDALSGYMQARSGATLVFSIIVNDRPLESSSASDRIDSTLLKIAEQY